MCIALIESIEQKFPRSRIPSNEEKRQDTLDWLEEKGIDFESEDTWFYENTEEDLEHLLIDYIKENRK